MEKPRGRNLRSGRISELGRIYLVTTVTRGRFPHFRDFHLGRLLVDVLRVESLRAGTLAYVVMPDHLHWLLQLGHSYSLSRVVADVKSMSSRRIGAASGWRGSLWQAGFHDHALRSEEDLLGIARYVVANPLRAGLARTVRDYPLWDAIWL